MTVGQEINVYELRNCISVEKKWLEEIGKGGKRLTTISREDNQPT